MANLPTLYEYYTTGGIKSGLKTSTPTFKLNEKDITIYSGSIHYFRIPKPYWKDRLRKMRAAGLNSIDTCIPWNLHEPEPGIYDFGSGNTEMSQFLDIELFLNLVQEEDLFAFVRPGPYIGADWDFGGLPSWLLRDEEMKLRSSKPNFMDPTQKYLNKLFKILAKFQFTKGGPIIGFELGHYFGFIRKDGKSSIEYFEELHKIYVQNNIVELLFSIEIQSKQGDKKLLPSFLFQTCSVIYDALDELKALKQLQPDKPLMVMNLYTGWCSNWGDEYSEKSAEEISEILEYILLFPASVNMYMFAGGTNWGFYNSATTKSNANDQTDFHPQISSYDFDAPISECGELTKKYYTIKKLIASFNNILTKLPDVSGEISKIAYPAIKEHVYLTLFDALSQTQEMYKNVNTIAMEMLPIRNVGQKFGFIVYRKQNLRLKPRSVLKINKKVCDVVLVLINGELISKRLEHAADLNEFGYWNKPNATLVLNLQEITNVTLDLLVINLGRSNFGESPNFAQYKGIWQDKIYLNKEALSDWQIFALEFKSSWIDNLKNWKEDLLDLCTPTLYKFETDIESPKDTFIDMARWGMGIVIVNGFVLGRYLFLGPIRSLASSITKSWKKHNCCF